jgi:surface antigen
VDFSKSVRLSENNSLAWHAAFGLAIPFGNSKVIPYEKRYFSGGANSVRGWNVRQLGPGRYAQKDGNIDFINQTGNLKIDLSMEYRSSLFWKFEGAAFVDAGNVWTTRGKTGPDGGQFRFDSCLRELAVAYGLGLRLNLNYFIVRFDGGMKAIDPAVPSGALHYPIFHPNLSRDFTLHFAVGLPF